MPDKPERERESHGNYKKTYKEKLNSDVNSLEMFKSCMNYSFTPGVMCAALLTLQGPTVKRNFRNGLAPRFADAAQRRPSFQSPTTMHKQKQKACSKLQESRQSKEGKRGAVSLNFKAVFARVLRGTRPRPATP